MILLNGCSFGWAWQSFPGINLSQSGGSITRSVRTTMEWIVANGKPDYVFIPLTMTSRFEIAMIEEQNIPIARTRINLLASWNQPQRKCGQITWRHLPTMSLYLSVESHSVQHYTQFGPGYTRLLVGAPRHRSNSPRQIL